MSRGWTYNEARGDWEHASSADQGDETEYTHRTKRRTEEARMATLEAERNQMAREAARSKALREGR